jgi:hypothetical protein
VSTAAANQYVAGGSLAPLRASFPWRVAPTDKTIKILSAADNPVYREVLSIPPAARGSVPPRVLMIKLASFRPR